MSNLAIKTAGLALCLVVSCAPALAEDPMIFGLVARDGTLQPAEIHAPAGRKLKIQIRNEGDEPIEFESLSLRKEKVLAPGASSAVIIAPLRAGRYEFFDEFHPETSQGTIIVE